MGFGKMKTKKVWRYICDFCGKTSGTKPSMAKHEKRCTLNPNRECGVCKMLEQEQTPIAKLTALLPDENQYRESWEGAPPDGFHYSIQFSVDVNAAIPELREATNNCPACMMAALRQAKIPLPIVEGFDYQKELDAVWNDFWAKKNQESWEAEQRDNCNSML